MLKVGVLTGTTNTDYISPILGSLLWLHVKSNSGFSFSRTKSWIFRAYYLLRTSYYHNNLTEDFTLRWQGYFWYQMFPKVEQEAEPSGIRPLSFFSRFGFRRQGSSLHLTLASNWPFWIKPPKPSLCYAAIGSGLVWDCLWCTISYLHSPGVYFSSSLP